MGLFSRNTPSKSNENAVVHDDYDYDYDPDRGYSDQTGGGQMHSLDTERAGVTTAQFRRLWKLNIAAFLFQAASAAAIYSFIDPDKKFNFFTNYPLQLELGNGTDTEVRIDLGPDPKVAFSYSIGWLSAVFLTLSALDHLIVSLPPFKGLYERGISNNYNIFRWIEYSLSASVMRVLIGVLSGVTDLHMQFLIFGLTLITMLFGMIFELENRKKRLVAQREIRWYLFWLGFIPHIFSWAVVVAFFFYSVSNGDPPNFVYAIIFIIFILDLTFAIVLGLQWLARGCFRPYVNGEIAFIVLSFTSKNLLAWINFIGGNR
jgi:hypothetical protein